VSYHPSRYRPTTLSIEELERLRLPDVKLDSVKVVSPGRQAEEHLQVIGTISGNIRFELLLIHATPSPGGRAKSKFLL